MSALPLPSRTLPPEKKNACGLMAPSGAHANGHPRTSPRVPVADRPHTHTQKGQKSPREWRTRLEVNWVLCTRAVKGYMCGGWDVACVRGVRMREEVQVQHMPCRASSRARARARARARTTPPACRSSSLALLLMLPLLADVAQVGHEVAHHGDLIQRTGVVGVVHARAGLRVRGRTGVRARGRWLRV